MLHVLGDVMGQDVRAVWHKETQLDGFGPDDCVVLPGGFSYGDYLRCGAVARFSPIMNAVMDFAEKGGTVWGVCNGFQILCEAGLLPGALLLNEQRRFSCKNVHLRVETDQSLLTRSLHPGQVLRIPIAHAEGRYYADEATLDLLETNDQVLFRYCDAEGATGTPGANPNGALRDIAGICNDRRNVFGMMPHPERAAEEALGNADGRYLFESLLALATA